MAPDVSSKPSQITSHPISTSTTQWLPVPTTTKPAPTQPPTAPPTEPAPTEPTTTVAAAGGVTGASTSLP